MDKTMLVHLIWDNTITMVNRLDQMNKVVIINTKCLRIVLVPAETKALDRRELIILWIICSKKLLSKTKLRKIILIGIEADSHLITIADLAVQTRRVRLRKIRRVMISLGMDSHKLAPFLVQEEVVLCIETGIGRWAPITEVGILLIAWILVVGHQEVSNPLRQLLKEQVISWIQHWKFKFKRRTKKEAQTIISKEILHLRPRMTDLTYCRNFTILQMSIKIITNNTIACTTM